MSGQSIFIKYEIWHSRLLKVNKLCCEDHAIKKLNRLQKIQWILINNVNTIENGYRTATSILAHKKVELLIIKDDNGRYINSPIESVNTKLKEYISLICEDKVYADFRELLDYAYEIIKLK
jgi:hypothetical protein